MGNTVKKEDRIETSIRKVKEKLLGDLKNSPRLIRQCYEQALTPAEESLVAVLIDTSFNIKP